ncbi:MAG: SBBP repeat-containing protein, partial [Promethearchaeota archaeon]
MKKGICSALLIILFGVSIQPAGSYTNWIDSPSVLIDNSVISEVTLSSFIGGSLADTVDSVVVDDFNNIYIAGRTRSNNIPSGGNLGFEYSGMNDYYVMKLNSTRDIVYTTYIGADGTEGFPSIDPVTACSIDVDNLGRVYMTGSTSSYYFPMVNAWDDENDGEDGFALRLSADGRHIEYSTFIGGFYFDICTAIKVDDSYNAFIVGWTNSDDFPTLNAYDYSPSGPTDMFLVKLNQNGQASFSTYIGGSGRELASKGSLALDDDGAAYVLGRTDSPDLPITHYETELNGPSSDLFIWKVDSTGTFRAGLYFGSSSQDEVGGIALDNQGYVYISGYTAGDLPYDYSIGPNPNAFVAKFDNNTLHHLRTTGFGGTDVNQPLGLVIDEEDCPWVTGYSYASDFPLEDPI